MIKKCADYIKTKIDFTPEIGIVLGSGLSSLGEKIKNPIYINYSEIENFPISTAPGHIGRFILGTLSEKKVICMQGRLHFYEGHSLSNISLPIRVMKSLGVSSLILTNAAGGINKSFNVGDIMLIDDHINFMGTNPLIGKNDAEIGSRFPDMSYAYNRELCEIAEKSAKAMGTQLKRGVYIGCTGPSYETPAEIRAFRILGADAVGMSTVPEVIAANHCGLKVLAFSLISNMAAGILESPLTEEEVLTVGAKKSAEMQMLIQEIIKQM
ncbi:MAG: purine-nucleoside phosphorylase [Oscillospiraceae bacterium]